MEEQNEGMGLGLAASTVPWGSHANLHQHNQDYEDRNKTSYLK